MRECVCLCRPFTVPLLFPLQYWKVKNSWSEKWGMGGYILLERGIKDDGGECGILLGASYPLL